jgi:hypothetical protein
VRSYLSPRPSRGEPPSWRFHVEEGAELLRRWLDDDRWVRPSEARIAEEQFEQRLAEWTPSEAVEPPTDKAKPPQICRFQLVGAAGFEPATFRPPAGKQWVHMRP